MVDIISHTPRISTQEFLPLYRRKYMLETLGRNRFSPYMGKEDSNVIQYIHDNKDEGESIQFAFLRELDDNGVAGGMRLRGVEAQPKREKMILKWDYQRNAIALKKSEEQKSIVQLAPEITPTLQKWSKRMLRNRIVDAFRMVAPDKTFAAPKYSVAASKVLPGFPALVQPTAAVAPTAAETVAWLTNNRDRVLFGLNDASYSTTSLSTALGNVTAATDGGSLSLLRKMHDLAKNSNPFIEPLHWDEEDATYYVAFCDSVTFRQFQAALEGINTDARAREGAGWSRNPIATGSDLEYDGIIIREITDMAPIVLDGGNWRELNNKTDSAAVKATAKGQVFLCGRQAIALGIAQEPKPINDTDDYGFIKGMGIEEGCGVNKFQRQDLTTLTSYIDHGCVTSFTNANA